MSLRADFRPSVPQFGRRIQMDDSAEEGALAALSASTTAPTISTTGSTASAGSTGSTASGISGSGSVVAGSGLMAGPQSSVGAGVIHFLQAIGLGGFANWMAANHILGGAGLALTGSSVIGKSAAGAGSTSAGSRLGN